jgi:hypothetical protein
VDLERALCASCRVRGKKGLGSATIISSRDHGEEELAAERLKRLNRAVNSEGGISRYSPAS